MINTNKTKEKKVEKVQKFEKIKKIRKYPKSVVLTNDLHERIKTLCSEKKMVANDVIQSLLDEHDRKSYTTDEDWKNLLSDLRQLYNDLEYDDLEDMFPYLHEFRKILEEKYTK